MTDTIDVAALASVLTTTAKQLQRQADNASFVAEGFIRVIDPPYLIEMLSEAATALQSQADALAEARRNSDIATRAAIDSGEALENAQEELATMREALEWYAVQVRNCRKLGNDGHAARAALDRDGGDFARRALGGNNAE